MRQTFSRTMSRRVSRRAALRGAGIGLAGLAGALLIGCGGDDATAAATVDPASDGDDGDDHDAGTEDAEAENSYLEAAPKDKLFLVKMGNFFFEPNVLEVKVDDVVEIAVQNVEPMVHDFTIDEIDADAHVSYLEGTGMHGHEGDGSAPQADVHVALTEAGVAVLHLKVKQAGEYDFYCTVAGHRELGMEGKLIVS